MSDLRKRNLRVVELELGAAGAYLAGDQVGAVTDLGKVAGSGARVQLVEVKVFDDDNVTPDLDFLLFESAPADAGDNAPFVLSAADLDKLVVSGSVAAADYNVVASRAIASVSVGSIGQMLKKENAGDGHLHLALVVQSAETLTAALRVQLVLEEES